MTNPAPGLFTITLPMPWELESVNVHLIELDEGVRLMGNVLECAPQDVHVGMRVHVTWFPLSDGRQLPQFAPQQ